MLNGVCYPLRMPSGLAELRASITLGNESGSLRDPTPTTSMMTLGDLEQARFAGSDPNRPGYDQAKRMPSIRKSDAERGGRGDLIQAVRGNPNKHFMRFPTVTVQDSENDGGESQYLRNTIPLNALVKRMPTVVSKSESGGRLGLDGGIGARAMMTEEEVKQLTGGSLNPDWTEWLMGWPIGWTALQPLEMDRYRKWLHSHGGF
jgi:hypothetical protein